MRSTRPAASTLMITDSSERNDPTASMVSVTDPVSAGRASTGIGGIRGGAAADGAAVGATACRPAPQNQ